MNKYWQDVYLDFMVGLMILGLVVGFGLLFFILFGWIEL